MKHETFYLLLILNEKKYADLQIVESNSRYSQNIGGLTFILHWTNCSPRLHSSFSYFDLALTPDTHSEIHGFLRRGSEPT